jgi:glycosyltransferase involved in cell wall biosynthesis
MMKEPPAVSAIITTFNYARYLPRAIESVLAQTFKDFEIVIVDDGSTDNTKEVVERYDGRVIYHYQTNRGPGASKNAGLKLATGKYIQFLDADDTIAPSKFEKQVSVFEGSDDIDVVYSDYLAVDYHGKEVPNVRLVLFPDFFGNLNEVDRLLHECFILVHTPLVRASVLKKENGLDETPGMSEDWDLWLRLAVKGYKFRSLPDVLAIYHKHDSSLTVSSEKLYTRRRLLVDKFTSELKSEVVALGDGRYERFVAYQNRKLADHHYDMPRVGALPEGICLDHLPVSVLLPTSYRQSFWQGRPSVTK